MAARTFLVATGGRNIAGRNQAQLDMREARSEVRHAFPVVRYCSGKPICRGSMGGPGRAGLR